MELHILGCGSAKPTLHHDPSAQLLNVRGKMLLLDAGEGVQKALRRQHLRFTQINHVFISHLHGDHVYGLLPFLSTLAHLHRTAPLHLYAHAALWSMLQSWLPFTGIEEQYELVFHPHPESCNEPQVICEDRSFTIWALPLQHRVPCCGFLVRETPSLPHIRRDMIDFLKIPHHAINNIKEGAGWTTAEGEYFPHERLTTPAAPPTSYAYCSDTSYAPALAEAVRGVSLLYHEATYADLHQSTAAERGHSTARQAAMLAREAQAQRLLLGHYSSRYSTEDEQQLLREACEEFAATELANEGKVIRF